MRDKPGEVQALSWRIQPRCNGASSAEGPHVIVRAFVLSPPQTVRTIRVAAAPLVGTEGILVLVMAGVASRPTGEPAGQARHGRLGRDRRLRYGAEP